MICTYINMYQYSQSDHLSKEKTNSLISFALGTQKGKYLLLELFKGDKKPSQPFLCHTLNNQGSSHGISDLHSFPVL